MKRPPPTDHYQPLSRRRKLLVLMMAIATGIAVTLTILYPPGGVKRHAPPPPPDAPRCAPGQTTDCVGGRAQVLAPDAAAETAVIKRGATTGLTAPANTSAAAASARQ